MRVVEKIKKIVKSYLETSALLEDLFGYYNGVTIYHCPNCNQPYFSNTPQPEPDNGFTNSTLISISFAKQDKCPYCNKPLKELIIPLNEYLNTINNRSTRLHFIILLTSTISWT